MSEENNDGKDWESDHQPGWTYNYENGWVPPEEEKEL